MLGILHAKVLASLLDNSANGRVVYVANHWEKVMLDLEVEPAQKPCEHAALAGEVDGRFRLMDGPRRLHSKRILWRHRKLGFLHAVCQLKHDAQDYAEHARHQHVEEQY